MKILKTMSFDSYRRFFPILIMIIVVGLISNIYLYKQEVKQTTTNMNYIGSSIDELQWEFVKGIIQDEYLAAGIQAKMMAERIDRDLKVNYPDISLLRYQLDFPSKVDNAAYTQIFKDDIRGVYFMGVKNDNNDPFIASRGGILMDLSLNCLPESLPRDWDTEFGAHYNKVLAKKSIKSILLKDPKITYWEYIPNDNPDHAVITEPTMENLHKLFLSEGLDGLKGIEFLAPAYITDNGDIFGVDDVNQYGVRSNNHKLIVIQGFNVYDQIKIRHFTAYHQFDERKELILREMQHSTTIRSIVVVFYTISIIAVVFALMLFNNRVFHENGFCPCDKEKEGDRKH